MPTVAIDWDDTLVGYKKRPAGWLPGAQDALRKLKKAGFAVVIHSCRANWPEGLAEIEQTLSDAGFRVGSRLKIHTGPGKPLAVAYVDDRAHHFAGDWDSTLAELGGDVSLRERVQADLNPRRPMQLPRKISGVVVY